ncbi:MAG: glycoside hydrolase family protein [Bacteroidota bacterium]|nr:glycoside hydrolase family protein [Bacteroidota bacterium]
MKMKIGFLCVVVMVALVSRMPVKAQPHSLKEFMKPAVKEGGFKMDSFYLWCPSVIKVGDTYHMFCSRWPARYGMGGWTKFSECVRATSKNLYGPYTFAEVVLTKRDGFWDNDRVHNVKIVKSGSTYVLYYISSKNETGYAYSDKITGPWTRIDNPAMKVTNPAILVNADKSVYVIGRGEGKDKMNIAIAFTAPVFKGEYKLLNNGANVLPNDYELEDPTIWWANNQYNMLCNDWKAKATGTFKAGAQYFSKDGVSYTLVSKEPVFTKNVVYDDGTSEVFSRRERPFVFVNENNEVTAFFSTCLPQVGSARIVVQPVDNYVP